VFTLRGGGVSVAPFESLNLGSHVEDSADAVAENRQRVRNRVGLREEPVWLQQVHGTSVVEIGDPARAPVVGGATGAADAPVADAAVTRDASVACAILVADCIPVLFASHDGAVVGAAHAGWRGLAGGVLENTVSEMRRLGAEPSKLSAWLGPGIGPRHFEVGGEVREAFLGGDAGAADAFVPNARGKWLCDLAALARRRLTRVGIRDVSGGEFCTYDDRDRFYSYRRDGRCGRMAALIWRE
jgi:hypothetical protein